ncbi:hypothetical protein GLAREA_03517 [Glarea lozoyensis ATCC 20868]|uniref:Uncharacterized protein n=1 Tax=Glarea lozoyensis (strain ATCC 20868 / MF5171) TaxID=1116229 RepID=S3CY62_GLAL2|nr:uncharacterized protein GLAREA_03517 [Glarea lozoyensis ATCC 20868]EPE30550.1 hypothetical protein GLAREA_03517 [Glarea lozoyensis ATCC 20868]
MSCKPESSVPLDGIPNGLGPINKLSIELLGLVMEQYHEIHPLFDFPIDIRLVCRTWNEVGRPYTYRNVNLVHFIDSEPGESHLWDQNEAAENFCAQLCKYASFVIVADPRVQRRVPPYPRFPQKLIDGLLGKTNPAEYGSLTLGTQRFSHQAYNSKVKIDVIQGIDLSKDFIEIFPRVSAIGIKHNGAVHGSPRELQSLLSKANSLEELSLGLANCQFEEPTLKIVPVRCLRINSYSWDGRLACDPWDFSRLVKLELFSNSSRLGSFLKFFSEDEGSKTPELREVKISLTPYDTNCEEASRLLGTFVAGLKKLRSFETTCFKSLDVNRLIVKLLRFADTLKSLRLTMAKRMSNTSPISFDNTTTIARNFTALEELELFVPFEVRVGSLFEVCKLPRLADLRFEYKGPSIPLGEAYDAKRELLRLGGLAPKLKAGCSLKNMELRLFDGASPFVTLLGDVAWGDGKYAYPYMRRYLVDGGGIEIVEGTAA